MIWVDSCHALSVCQIDTSCHLIWVVAWYEMSVCRLMGSPLFLQIWFYRWRNMFVTGNQLTCREKYWIWLFNARPASCEKDHSVVTTVADDVNTIVFTLRFRLVFFPKTPKFPRWHLFMTWFSATLICTTVADSQCVSFWCSSCFLFFSESTRKICNTPHFSLDHPPLCVSLDFPAFYYPPPWQP